MVVSASIISDLINQFGTKTVVITAAIIVFLIWLIFGKKGPGAGDNADGQGGGQTTSSTPRQRPNQPSRSNQPQQQPPQQPPQPPQQPPMNNGGF